jgi:hypothetical protein
MVERVRALSEGKEQRDMRTGVGCQSALVGIC